MCRKSNKTDEELKNATHRKVNLDLKTTTTTKNESTTGKQDQQHKQKSTRKSTKKDTEKYGLCVIDLDE